jgi:hypothetical protein
MNLKTVCTFVVVCLGLVGAYRVGRLKGVESTRAQFVSPSDEEHRRGLTCYMNGLGTSEGGVVKRDDGAKVECVPVKADWIVLDAPTTP